MSSTRLDPSSINNKAKRQAIARKLKRENSQRKLRSRLAISKAELADPAVKKVRLPSFRCQVNRLDNAYRLAQNVPVILENQREFDRSVLTTDPRRVRDNVWGSHLSAYRGFKWLKHSTHGVSVTPETFADIDSGPLASYFLDWDPKSSPKALITTFARSWRTFSPGPDSSGGRRDEDLRWVGLQGGPQTEDVGCE